MQIQFALAHQISDRSTSKFAYDRAELRDLIYLVSFRTAVTIDTAWELGVTALTS
jgi:hypothetical protein